MVQGVPGLVLRESRDWTRLHGHPAGPWHETWHEVPKTGSGQGEVLLLVWRYLSGYKQ
jgi:hypothetical protein